ncbi:MAG: hypothetical protein AB7V62_09845 [Thermoleophilia bacterium]
MTARAALQAAALAAAALVGAHVGVELVAGAAGIGRGTGAVDMLRHHVDLNGERNAPALLAVLLLLACAALMARAGWWALAALFVLLAADEGLEGHERLIGPAQSVLGDAGPLHHAWIVPYGLAVAALAWALRGFLAGLDGPTRTGMLRAAALYLGGAIGLEALGGALVPGGGPVASVLQAAEEGLELAGLLVLAGVLLERPDPAAAVPMPAAPACAGAGTRPPAGG